MLRTQRRPDDDDEPEVEEESEEDEEEDGGVPIPLTEKKVEKQKKRKRKDEDDNLEGAYFEKLEKEEQKEIAVKEAEEERKAKKLKKKEKAEKKEKKEKKAKKSTEGDADEAEDGAADKAEDAASGSDWDTSDSESDSDTSKPIVHESLLNKDTTSKSAPAVDTEVDKSQRTIFIGNVSSSVISTKADYRTLRSTFRTCGPIESIRFRSIAFAAQIPRKAAYLTHKLHETQTTLNAYIVFKSKDAMRAALKLNGAVVLDRHLRVDSVAHPAEQNPKRCVFVGNLDFEAQEEMLWRHFAQCGKVESVRLVRDAATNVGKGFAYVQFEEENAVEKALLLNDKKPAPKDRKLRVVRARKVKKRVDQEPKKERAPKKKAKKAAVFNPKADPAAASTLGRAKTLLGKAGAAQLKDQVKALEGVRASNTMPSGVKNAPKLRPLKKKDERALRWKKDKIGSVEEKVKKSREVKEGRVKERREQREALKAKKQRADKAKGKK